jgi:hypothetical protein
MGNLKKYRRHPTVIIFHMVTKVFQLSEKGPCHIFFENLSTILDEGAFQKISQAPFCGD